MRAESCGSTKLFLDESGFTGPALLDRDQPNFVIASSVIGDDEAAKILRDAFPKYQGSEFKFKNIWSRQGHRSRLTEFSKAIGEHAEKAFIWRIDKQFCVLIKLIDHLVEPICHDAGFDFYENAHAYKFSNYIHYGLKHIGSPELYDATLRAYHNFARDPSERTLRLLGIWFTIARNSVPEELRFFYELVLFGIASFHEHSNIDTFADTLEIHLTSVLSSVGHWSLKKIGKLEIVHDQSNSFFSQQEIWNAIVSDDVPYQLHPVANGPPIEFPLPVASTCAADSKTSPAIQLCDVLAGLAAKVVVSGHADNDAVDFSAILKAGLGRIDYNGIVPGTDFPDDVPAKLDGPDIVDRMNQIIRSGKAAEFNIK